VGFVGVTCSGEEGVEVAEAGVSGGEMEVTVEVVGLGVVEVESEVKVVGSLAFKKLHKSSELVDDDWLFGKLNKKLPFSEFHSTFTIAMPGN